MIDYRSIKKIGTQFRKLKVNPKEFGVIERGDQIIFYTKGADRTTGFPESLPVVDEMLAFGQAHRLWLSLQEGVKKFVKDNHGEATVLDPFSKRFKWSLVKRYLELNSNRGTIT